MSENTAPISVKSPTSTSAAFESKAVREAHTRSADSVLEELGTAREGLSPGAAAERLDRYGPNRLREAPPPSPWARLLAQFTDVTVLALLVAAAVAVVLGMREADSAPVLERFGDAIAIGTIVVLNAAIGFIQERRAEAALKALADLTAPTARVRRGGEERVVVAAEVVPGDVVLLGEGDRIAADVRLFDTTRLSVSEAALTGESMPVDKSTGAIDASTPLAERRNMAFMGTHVGSGRGAGVVVATGMATELGRIAGMLGSVAIPETPLQRDLRGFGTRLVIGCVAVGFVVFGIGLARGQATVGTLFMTAISLAVAAIPEGLPAVTTIVLALGVRRMARRQALVRRLSAVETLGSAQVICTDKTGTLTENRMTARRVATPSKAFHAVESDGDPAITDESGAPVSLEETPSLRALIAACRFAPAARLDSGESGERTVVGDPTDGALLLLAADHDERADPGAVERETPFDSTKKMATVWAREGDDLVAYGHGAPEAVLAPCGSLLDEAGRSRPLDEPTRARVLEIVDDWAGRGLRVLGLSRQAGDDTVFLGLVGISDPPRAGVREAIVRATAAGIRTVMITGDHPRTAAAIAEEIGLPSRDVVSGSEIDSMSEQDLGPRSGSIDVVARATAAHKLRFVEALTGRGVVVAMTGDGVNDAPALRASTIGIAMGRGGTDVAREAADIVLADDNYATIVAAVEEGRIIFANIQRFIVFLLSINAGLVVAVFVAAMAGWPPLLNPTQILWINLVTNGLPALALGMEGVHLDHMNEPPRDPGAGLLSARKVVWLSLYGLWMALLGLGVFAAYGESDVRARTMAFTVLALAPMFHALTCRSWTRSALSIGLLSNRALLASFAVALALQGAAVYMPGMTGMFRTCPLSPSDVGVALGLSVTVWLVGEAEKLLGRLSSSRRAAEPLRERRRS